MRVSHAAAFLQTNKKKIKTMMIKNHLSNSKIQGSVFAQVTLPPSWKKKKKRKIKLGTKHQPRPRVCDAAAFNTEEKIKN